MGRDVKNSLEIIIKQVRLEGGFERRGKIRVAECLRQVIVRSEILTSREVTAGHLGTIRINRDNENRLFIRAQDLCESRRGRAGLPSLINLRFLRT